jgi:hypothetical protein
LSFLSYCQDDVAERLLTMLLIKNTDVNRFGSFVEELHSQQSLKNDRYPRTVLAAQEFSKTEFGESPILNTMEMEILQGEHGTWILNTRAKS